MNAHTATALGRTETIAQLNDIARQGRDRQCKLFFTTNLLGKLGDGSFAADIAVQQRIMRGMRDCAQRIVRSAIGRSSRWENSVS